MDGPQLAGSARFNGPQSVQSAPESAPRIGGLVLAAGAGSRMGHRPKCLLQWDGMSLLERQLEALSLAGVMPMGVVLGHHAERILKEGILARWAALPVLNPEPNGSHVSSLRAGLRAMPHGLDAVVVALADQPLVHAQAVQELLQAFARRPPGTQLLQPSVQGLPGNPVVFSGTVVAEILAGDAGMGARQWQQAHPEAAWHWETPHPHYRLDIDNEDDRLAFEKMTGKNLHWPHDLNLSE